VLAMILLCVNIYTTKNKGEIMNFTETFGFYQADKRDMLKKAGEMTYEKLQQLEELKKAEVIETKYEGTCQLWEVVGHEDKYVVLVDNSVMTQREDNDSDEVIFPF